MRTGSSWRSLPADYGGWKNTHRRFSRWRDKGRWEAIIASLANEPDLEWLSTDATRIKVQSRAAEDQSSNEAMNRTKGGSIPNYI